MRTLTTEQKRLLLVDHERSVLLSDQTADASPYERYLLATWQDREAMWSEVSERVAPLTWHILELSKSDLMS